MLRTQAILSSLYENCLGGVTLNPADWPVNTYDVNDRYISNLIRTNERPINPKSELITMQLFRACLKGESFTLDETRCSNNLSALLSEWTEVDLSRFAINESDDANWRDYKTNEQLDFLQILLTASLDKEEVDRAQISRAISEKAYEDMASELLVFSSPIRAEPLALGSEAKRTSTRVMELLLESLGIDKSQMRQLFSAGANSQAALGILNNEDLTPLQKIAMMKQVNEVSRGLRIVRNALPDISPDSPFETVRASWLVDFFDKAGKVTEEETAAIFSKVFSVEMNAPGTISRRLLSMLFQIEDDDARHFRNLTRFCFYDYNADSFYPIIYIKARPDTYSSAGITSSILSRLEHIGLVDVDYERGFTVGPEARLQYSSTRFDISGKNINIGNVRLTKEGISLLRIIPKTEESNVAEFTIRMMRKNGQEQAYEVTVIDRKGCIVI